MRLHQYLNEQGKDLIIEYSLRQGKACPEEIEGLFKAMEDCLNRLNRGESNEK